MSLTSGPSIGVILLQIGSPDAPTPQALRRYLREFLSDRRVVDLPRALWLPVLYLRVLATRPRQSAHLYSKIWTAEGSPLAVTTAAQADGLAARLDRSGTGRVKVAYAMRYGRPALAQVADELVGAGCDRLLAVPMYPQYAGATTGSGVEQLLRWAAAQRVVPAIRVVPPFYADPACLAALAAITRKALGDWVPDRVLMSFHGMPVRYVRQGDPYAEQCRYTARALAALMGWEETQAAVAFQSRFGREEWLRPYTDETLIEFGRQGIGKLAVICPGFTADCLETLEEIALTGRGQFERAGGGEFRYVPCVNVEPAWLDALASLVGRELAGWIETG